MNRLLRFTLLALDAVIGCALMGVAMYRAVSHDLYWSGGRE